jgi:hypothetical protein
MMDFEFSAIAIAFIGFSTVGWLINNWIRARHGYALEDEWGGKTERAASSETAALRAENAELKQRLAKAEDRIGVVERIVTDKGYDVAAQIEALRDPQLIETRSTKETI